MRLNFPEYSISTAQHVWLWDSQQDSRRGRTDVCRLSPEANRRKVISFSSKVLQLFSWTVSSDLRYIFTCSLCCLSAAPGTHLGVVSVHKSVLSTANCYPYEFQNMASLDLNVPEKESDPISRKAYLISVVDMKGNRSPGEVNNLFVKQTCTWRHFFFFIKEVWVP